MYHAYLSVDHYADSKQRIRRKRGSRLSSRSFWLVSCKEFDTGYLWGSHRLLAESQLGFRRLVGDSCPRRLRGGLLVLGWLCL